ncbi:DMT family transporter [Halomonas garicola]|uniref:DMT family transporter n=1 Tax=Halomonas garicola TaxID=1690008 RepID=UPI0028A25269|nr:DMT family transporter [Halomonas garicola]
MSSFSTAAAAPRFFPRPLALLVLMGVATMFAGNHVAARVTFDNGTGLLLAILVRAAVAVMVLGALVVVQRKSLVLPTQSRPWLMLAGLLIAVQSLFLYSAVARIPVVVALLLMNTFPIQLGVLTWALGGPRPSGRMALIMAIILAGLVVVLEVPAWLANSEAMGPGWLSGVGLGLGSATAYAGALWLTEHRLGGVSSTLRSLLTMATVLLVMVLAGGLGLVPSGMALPESARGLWSLVTLALLYGVAFSVLFICLPRLDIARNAPAMNAEPVAALVLGFLVLGQALSSIQLVGGGIVMAGIVLLGMSRQA